MIGEKVRKKRIELNLTQQRLADSIGITKSYISQIEKAKVIPSISKLKSIAKVLNVDMVYLLEPNGNNKNNVEPILKKKNEYDIIRLHGGKEEWIILPPGANQGKIISIVGILKPKLVEFKNMTVKGHKLIYVIKGKIDFFYDEKTFKISKGDSLFIDGSIPHGWKNPYNYTAKALVTLLD